MPRKDNSEENAATIATGQEHGHDLMSFRRLGFQSNTPRTDVRAGRFALDQLHYLAATYPEKLRQLVRQAEELDYPLAIGCFNLTHMVVVFFDLCNDVTVSPVAGASPANKVIHSPAYVHG
mmetsp:Transcript_126804/g.406018  ORF Transcript_126804/g.406018 Transcript_126804/m.406018 type:complete len:121 (-) Transcript_126804:276-638(-)